MAGSGDLRLAGSHHHLLLLVAALILAATRVSGSAAAWTEEKVSDCVLRDGTCVALAQCGDPGPSLPHRGRAGGGARLRFLGQPPESAELSGLWVLSTRVATGLGGVGGTG